MKKDFIKEISISSSQILSFIIYYLFVSYYKQVKSIIKKVFINYPEISIINQSILQMRNLSSAHYPIGRTQIGKQLKINLPNPSKIETKTIESPRAPKYLSASEYPIGLKNLGNTCFLNSIIQFLYAIQDMRNDLLLKYGLHNSMGNARFSKLLGKVFSYMKQKSKDSTKIEQILRLMADRLLQINSNYEKWSQGDALQTLLNILQEIESKHPDIPGALDIQYQSSCRCGTTTTKERVLTYSPTTCVTCNQVISKKINGSPKYVIYSNAGKQRPQKYKIQQSFTVGSNKIAQNRQLVYKLKAQIVHSGTQRFGHYKTYRKDQNHWIYLSDLHVYSFASFPPENGLILLYQFNKQLQKQNPTINVQSLQISIHPVFADQKDKNTKQGNDLENKQPLCFRKEPIKCKNIQKPELNQKEPIKCKNIQQSALNQIRNIQYSLNTVPTKSNTWINQTAIRQIQQNKIQLRVENSELQSHKIQLNKNYQFKLKLSSYPSYSLLLQVWKTTLNGYRLHIHNHQLTLQYLFGISFHDFYCQFIVNKQNQLQTLGKYLQEFINKCASKQFEKGIYWFRKYEIGRKIYIDPDLVYNVDKSQIELNKLALKQAQVKPRFIYKS